MGYKLVTLQDVGNLPRRGGTLGLDVERARQITDSGMTFALLGIKKVRSRSAGAAAGFKTGDRIIAVDGQVFSDGGRLRVLHRIAPAGFADHGGLHSRPRAAG